MQEKLPQFNRRDKNTGIKSESLERLRKQSHSHHSFSQISQIITSSHYVSLNKNKKISQNYAICRSIEKVKVG